MLKPLYTKKLSFKLDNKYHRVIIFKRRVSVLHKLTNKKEKTFP